LVTTKAPFEGPDLDLGSGLESGLVFEGEGQTAAHSQLPTSVLAKNTHGCLCLRESGANTWLREEMQFDEAYRQNPLI